VKDNDVQDENEKNNIKLFLLSICMWPASLSYHDTVAQPLPDSQESSLGRYMKAKILDKKVKNVL